MYEIEYPSFRYWTKLSHYDSIKAHTSANDTNVARPCRSVIIFRVQCQRHCLVQIKLRPVLLFTCDAGIKFSDADEAQMGNCFPYDVSWMQPLRCGNNVCDREAVHCYFCDAYARRYGFGTLLPRSKGFASPFKGSMQYLVLPAVFEQKFLVPMSLVIAFKIELVGGKL